MRGHWAIILPLLCAATLTCAADDVASTDASEPRALQAIIMDVGGRARWRPSADAPWNDARVNDLLDPGAEVRTGLRSRVTLRVGRNATVLVDSGTSFEIPKVVMDGGTLRTTALVKSGRVDFKVDKVGYANDFQVVTPQTTLAVRGTGFGLSTGPLQGIEVTGARTNAINAIEVKYVASNLSYFMSGPATTSSEREDPVQNAWTSTIGPPPVVGLLADNSQLDQQVAQGQSGNAPTNPQQEQQIAAAEINGQGGNGLIVAASMPGASDEIKQLANDVSGNDDAAPPPATGGGDFIDDIDNLALRYWLYVSRTGMPAYTAASAAMSSEASTLVTASSQLEGRVAITFPNGTVLSSQVPALHELYDEMLAYGQQASLIEYQEAIDAVEAVMEREIFSTGVPVQLQAGAAAGAGSRVDDEGVVAALANAREWSSADLSSSTGSLRAVQDSLSVENTEGALFAAQALFEGVYSIWTLSPIVYVPSFGTGDGEGHGTGSGPTLDPVVTPLYLALTMNERVQASWTELAGAVNAALGSHYASVDGSVGAVIDRLESSQIGGFGSTWQAFLNEYRALALQDGSPAAQQALAQMDALATTAGTAVESALQGALDSLESAGRARNMGHRVLQNAQAAALMNRAAGIALACQESLTGTYDANFTELVENGILQNAFGISQNYAQVLAALQDAGVQLPPGLNPITLGGVVSTGGGGESGGGDGP
jgi:hypothetical protein